MYDRLPGSVEISNLDFAGYSQLFCLDAFPKINLEIGSDRAHQTSTRPPFYYSESSCLQTSQFRGS